MRRIGRPRESANIDSVEANLTHVDAAIAGFGDKPYYQGLVRQLNSPEAQEFYWPKLIYGK